MGLSDHISEFRDSSSAHRRALQKLAAAFNVAPHEIDENALKRVYETACNDPVKTRSASEYRLADSLFKFSDHDQLLVLNQEARDYWAAKEVIEMKNGRLKELFLNLVTMADETPALIRESGGTSVFQHPQFPPRFAELVSAAVKLERKFKLLRNEIDQGSETQGEKDSKKRKIQALEEKRVSELIFLFKSLATSKDGKLQAPPLSVELAEAFVNFEQNEWEQYLVEQHRSFDGSLSDFIGVAESDGTGRDFANSLLALLNGGDQDIFDRVLNLKTGPLQGNKIVEAWVHMIVYLVSNGMLQDGVRQRLAELALESMESAAEDITREDRKNGYARATIEEMERRVRSFSAPLLDINEQAVLDGVGSFSAYNERFAKKYWKMTGGKSDGSPGTPSSVPPQGAAPTSTPATSAAAPEGAITGFVASGETYTPEIADTTAEFNPQDNVTANVRGVDSSLMGAHLAAGMAVVTPLMIAPHFAPVMK